MEYKTINSILLKINPNKVRNLLLNFITSEAIIKIEMKDQDMVAVASSGRTYPASHVGEWKHISFRVQEIIKEVHKRVKDRDTLEFEDGRIEFMYNPSQHTWMMNIYKGGNEQ